MEPAFVSIRSDCSERQIAIALALHRGCRTPTSLCERTKRKSVDVGTGASDVRWRRRPAITSARFCTKKGTLILTPLSFKLKVMRAYALNRVWITGFLMDICGAILMLRALSLAPVSVIQPISGVGLAMLSIFSHFYLKELMNAVDWLGIALAGIGTIVSAGGEEQKASPISILHLPWLGFFVAILFVFFNGRLHICRGQRKKQELMQFEVVEEVIYGLESGILFGQQLGGYRPFIHFKILLSILLYSTSIVNLLGFVLLEQGFSKILLPISMAVSLCCSGTGLFYQTTGLKHGRAIVVTTCAAVASIVTGVLSGMLALGEHLPLEPSNHLLLLLGWLLITLGVIVLVSSSTLAVLVRWKVKRDGLVKNFGKKQSGSTRSRDPDPAAVIHTNTLHHLLTSCS